MVDADEIEFLEVIVDTAMASEGAVSVEYLRGAPIEEVIRIRDKVRDICNKRNQQVKK